MRVRNIFWDGIQFWNPGDVFGDDSRLFEPGEKEVRNPAITMAMRRIAMCEQAGTGMRMMREEWQKLGHPIPTYNNDRAWKAFEFFIPELDKEVDMASDLMKAMFSGATQVDSQGAHAEAHAEAHGPMGEMEKKILNICSTGTISTPELLQTLGYGSRTGNFKRALSWLLDKCEPAILKSYFVCACFEFNFISSIPLYAHMLILKQVKLQ